MKRKTITKIIIDVIMTILFTTLIFADQTGYVFHEVFGVGVCVLILVHLLLNGKWIRNVSHNLSRVKGKVKGLFALNMLLFVGILGLLISGILISIILIPSMNLPFRPVLVIAHTWIAYISAGLIGVHILIHIPYLKKMCLQISKNGRTKEVRQVAVATLALCIVSLMLYAKAIPILSGLSEVQAETAAKETTTEEPAVTPTPTADTSDEALTTAKTEETGEDLTASQEAATPAVTLEEFLGGMTCTGCPKNCSLLSPRCGKGEAQAQEATATYEATYTS